MLYSGKYHRLILRKQKYNSLNDVTACVVNNNNQASNNNSGFYAFFNSSVSSQLFTSNS